MKIQIKTARFTGRKRIITTYGIFIDDKFKKEFLNKKDAEKYAWSLKK